MTEQILSNTLQSRANWVEDKKGKGLSEAATRMACIDPILKALGWDTENDDEVSAEWSPVQAVGRADYALFLNLAAATAKTPIAIIEAKALDGNLNETAAIVQTLNYAQNYNCPWAVLTNGRLWRLYDVRKPNALWSEKLVWTADICDPATLNELRWLSKAKLPFFASWQGTTAATGSLVDSLNSLFLDPQEDLLTLVGSRVKLKPAHVKELLKYVTVDIAPLAQSARESKFFLAETMGVAAVPIPLVAVQEAGAAIANVDTAIVPVPPDGPWFAATVFPPKGCKPAAVRIEGAEFAVLS